MLYWKQENQTATCFLRTRLFTYDLMKISTAISIKHRILATFNIKTNQFELLYAFRDRKFNILIGVMFLKYHKTFSRKTKKKQIFFI